LKKGKDQRVKNLKAGGKVMSQRKKVRQKKKSEEEE
jgi:hypothetical protein